ncbi:hypothetical protein SETIT_1G285300v2 [Setaria italica]|uniref:Uncharacterized protein n=2 Tax=Setaria TaxID=4554 RepID=A0A368PQ67_SETIT|nr:hypothetical protein SETIT_1G285300v2 [Setaria italica]TKW41080.1 hypothetical protein SEVIR_1G290700v2 [Setaria viridis]
MTRAVRCGCGGVVAPARCWIRYRERRGKIGVRISYRSCPQFVLCNYGNFDGVSFRSISSETSSASGA